MPGSEANNTIDTRLSLEGARLSWVRFCFCLAALCYLYRTSGRVPFYLAREDDYPPPPPHLIKHKNKY